MAENGKWQFAFFIITVFTFAVGGGVIYNDRVRAEEDQKITSMMIACDKQIVNDFGSKLDIIISQNTETKTLLAATLTKVDINSGRISKIEDRIYK
jgi:hypothetical protein